MPEINWRRPMTMGKREHYDYISQVKEIMKDLDFALRCYYISLGDDTIITEEEKVAFLKHAFEEGLKEVGVNYETVVRFNASS